MAGLVLGWAGSLLGAGRGGRPQTGDASSDRGCLGSPSSKCLRVLSSVPGCDGQGAFGSKTQGAGLASALEFPTQQTWSCCGQGGGSGWGLRVPTELWMSSRGTGGCPWPRAGGCRECARWGLLLAPRRSGLAEGFLNCFIWCWGCFYRSLGMQVKDARWLNKHKQWTARSHGRDGSLQPFPMHTAGCPRHGGSGSGSLAKGIEAQKPWTTLECPC